jgi:heptosyltransferase-2
MPEVRRSVPLDVAHGELAIGRRWSVARSLRGEGYDRAIILPRSAKSALLPFLARVPVRIGYRAELRSVLLTDARRADRGRLEPTVRRMAALGLPPGEPLPDPLPYPSLRIDERNRSALVGRLALDGSRPALVLMPGAAYGPAKQWPIENFAAVAQAALGRQEPVWVLGSAAERALGDRIVELAGAGVRNLCGETRLEDAVDLLSLASAAVTNDSGLMHVAAAAGARVIAIYGSSSPAYTPPLTSRSTVHYLALPCSPCFRRECPLGHLRCLREISPAEIRKSLDLP